MLKFIFDQFLDVGEELLLSELLIRKSSDLYHIVGG